MSKIINFIFLIIILIFFFNIFKYYSSNFNIKNMNLNRLNIEESVKNKTSNLPFLKSDTNNVIEFNDSFTEEIKNDKPRSFWDLLKVK